MIALCWLISDKFALSVENPGCGNQLPQSLPSHSPPSLIENSHLNAQDHKNEPSWLNDGHSAKRIEMGRMRNTTGIMSPISAFPAFCIISVFCAKRESRTCEIRIGLSADPLSIPRIKLVMNRRREFDAYRFFKWSSASTTDNPFWISSTTVLSARELTEFDLSDISSIDLAGLIPEEINMVNSWIWADISDSISLVIWARDCFSLLLIIEMNVVKQNRRKAVGNSNLVPFVDKNIPARINKVIRRK